MNPQAEGDNGDAVTLPSRMPPRLMRVSGRAGGDGGATGTGPLAQMWDKKAGLSNDCGFGLLLWGTNEQAWR